ncbi:PI-PLC domain-containing protein [Pseudochryseolinea flava]|uniref:Alkaline phosphatase n=1 Tax=Pseudochryseolinea flava TaxID=2059302 RepID=A0A364Y2L0_9BACT|nr:hypothetical protein [Pseudochryseolinea flava]RAW00016.1 hypothetical protein DQQ10_15785 [Pseudochryseolinea flava]
MMIKITISLVACILSVVCYGQKVYTSYSVLSHNDYEQAVPFSNAYEHRVGFIEADVFLEAGTLVVAHSHDQIDIQKTLTAMYLDPLAEKTAVNNKSAYPDHEKVLTLMIDLKSEGVSTLTTLVNILKNYPSLTSCKTLKIVISGNVPSMALWNTFPDYIYFDGRPYHSYSKDNLQRIAFISDDFKRYTSWRGIGEPNKEDVLKIKEVLSKCNQQMKPFRFWGVPDTVKAWSFLTDMRVDIIGTDHVTQLVDHLNKTQE